jgi:preprotein translocase subunit SecA
VILGSITIRHFMKLFPKIAGLTATAVSAGAELGQAYGLSIAVIHTNKKMIRTDAPDLVFATKRAKQRAVIDEIVRVHATGRPILVGTRTVLESEELASLLRPEGIEATVLNAKNDTEEAQLVACAGMLGAVTVSTNMAGRGTDIRLGGEDAVHRDRILRLGGLYVIGTNKHESVRTDNQLRGRAGRQGDPGLSRFFVSLEDDLFVTYGIRELVNEKHLGSDSSGSIRSKNVLAEINRAQAIVEAQHFEARRMLGRYSEIVEKQRQYISVIRSAALSDRAVPDELWRKCRVTLSRLSNSIGKKKAGDALRMIFIKSIDRFWIRHLEFISNIKCGIALRRLGGKEPLQIGRAHV